MCLVAFQNIFRKIFSGVWKRSWKRRRKRQNPEKPEQNPEEHSAISRSTAQSRDRRRDLMIDGAISRSVDRDWRERCFARDHAARSRILSLSRSPFTRALFARSQFRKSFEVKIGTEMNFRGQRYYFTIN